MRNKFNHKIDWRNSRLICKERDGHLRKIKEGIFIQQAKTKSKIINDDDGLVLSNQWKPIIPVLEEKTLEKLWENKFPVVTFNQYNLRSNARPRPSVNYR